MESRSEGEEFDGASPGQRGTPRVAGGAGLVFAALYLAHVVLQSPGPADGSAATVAAYFTGHRVELLLGEALGAIGLVVFVLFLAALVGPLRWRSPSERVGARAVLVSGTVFVALGLVSTATETALIRIAATGEPGAILTLFELQATVPVVFAVTAFTGATGITVLRTRLLPRWLGVGGLVASGVFLIGAVLSVFGTAEGESSPFGPALFLVWMLVLCVGLLRADR